MHIAEITVNIILDHTSYDPNILSAITESSDVIGHNIDITTATVVLFE